MTSIYRAYAYASRSKNEKSVYIVLKLTKQVRLLPVRGPWHLPACRPRISLPFPFPSSPPLSSRPLPSLYFLPSHPVPLNSLPSLHFLPSRPVPSLPLPSLHFLPSRSVPSFSLPSLHFLPSRPVPSLPLPSLYFISSRPFPFLPLPFPPLPSPPPLTFHRPSLPLEVGPLNPAKESGESCKLPQRGLGQSPCRNRILCILALKSDVWW